MKKKKHGVIVKEGGRFNKKINYLKVINYTSMILFPRKFILNLR